MRRDVPISMKNTVEDKCIIEVQVVTLYHSFEVKNKTRAWNSPPPPKFGLINEKAQNEVWNNTAPFAINNHSSHKMCISVLWV